MRRSDSGFRDRQSCSATSSRTGAASHSRTTPLTDDATIIDLIAAAATTNGLKVEAALDATVYDLDASALRSFAAEQEPHRREIAP
jgi:hypothetical protein